MSLGVLLQRLKGVRVLVVGDVMLDEYIFGRATRISQEAPVMVVRQERTTAVPGGAANVAANISALGGIASLHAVVGDDLAGDRLGRVLKEGGLVDAYLLPQVDRPTTTKTRVLANHAHQVLRIDHEVEEMIEPHTEQALLASIVERLAEIDVVLISDYRKGGVTAAVVEALIEHGSARGVPVVANIKPKSRQSYMRAGLVSVNRFEAAEALGLASLADEDAEDAASRLRDELKTEAVVVTLGASGMAAVWSGGSAFVPALRVDVYDEAGAGDTVIATLAMAVGARAFDREALELAIQTAAAVVQKVGVATPSASDLERISKL